MEREIRGLDAGVPAGSARRQRGLYRAANRIPNVVREIGRLREITFRQTGEGTGKVD